MSRLRTRYGKGLVGHLSEINMTLGLLFAVLLFSGCTEPETNQNSSTPPPQTNSSPANVAIQNASPPTAAPSSSPLKKGDHSLTATPNPVPAGSGTGTTIIAWRTSDIPSEQVHVYVIGLDGKETLFATGSEGSQAAPRITADVPVEFRLYSGSGAKRKLLDKITVTRNK